MHPQKYNIWSDLQGCTEFVETVTSWTGRLHGVFVVNNVRKHVHRGCAYQQQEAEYWPRSSLLLHLGNKLLHAFLPATVGTVWLRLLQWLQDKQHLRSETDKPPLWSLVTGRLTENQTHGKGLEMDRIINPDIHLKKRHVLDHKHSSYIIYWNFIVHTYSPRFHR